MAHEANDKMLDAFADLVIEKLKTIKKDWTKPWVAAGAMSFPRNMEGRPYNGINAFMLLLAQEKNNWDIPVYATFKRITEMNYAEKDGQRVPKTGPDGEKLPYVCVSKGAKGMPVSFLSFTVVSKDGNRKISYGDYKQLTNEEKKDYRVLPRQHVYTVFNVATQTNLSQARPQEYEKLVAPYRGEKAQAEHTMAKDAKLASMRAMVDHDLWVCPIKEQAGSNHAYYSPGSDHIVVPAEEQFKAAESFFSTLAHEMAHSTGVESRLARPTMTESMGFGSEGYAKEELVAELTAALVCAGRGIEKTIGEDSVPYLKSWLENLQEDPEFIKTLMPMVKAAEKMETQRLEAIDKLMSLGADLSQYSREELGDYEHQQEKERYEQYENEQETKTFRR